jgi:hypothetical protein
MKYNFVIVLLLLTSFSSVSFAQHKITITRVESLRAAPSVGVSRDSLENIPGTVLAPIDSKPMRPIPEYVYSFRSIGNIPMPSPNPLRVEFCEVDIYPFEE